MPRIHRPYAAEFRRRMVDLVRAGRTPESLGEEFEPSAQAIRNWLRQADRDELRQLRRDNARLREEREILKKATAWFARETDVTPSGPSRS